MSESTPRSRLGSHRAKWRDNLYIIIFEADTRAGQLFDIGLLAAIVLSIVVISLETLPDLPSKWLIWLQLIESFLTLLFTAEYIARLICSPKPWRYAISFFGIVDLLACLPMYLAYFMDVDSKSLMIVRSIRLLRVFRVLKMMRMLREADVLKEAVWKARDKIYVFLATVLVAVTISGTLMYQVEQWGKNNQFTSIPQSMYWAVVTMTTVGYGDVVPHTPIGKVISTILILVGYSLIIVPTGFVSAEIQAQKRVLHDYNSRTCPNCMREGHSNDALYCDMCGHRLVDQ
ncbi:MAG: ion transporter [Planctomycetales bacterium]|nr:ion transporter [Planctomycetales bacterium]